MPYTKDTNSALNKLLNSQKFGVLATQGQGQPYASLVAFVASDDFKFLAFATQRGTRKYSNMTFEPRAAILIDNRKNTAKDISSAAAVTAVGQVRKVNKTNPLCSLLLAKHPDITDFIKSKDCAIMCLDVSSYYFVDHFQKVTEIKP